MQTLAFGTHTGTHDHSGSSILSREQPTSECDAVDSLEVNILVDYHFEAKQMIR